MTPDDPGGGRAAREVVAAHGAAPERLMAIEVKLPRLGQGMESGTIVRWLKAEGDGVRKGEPLYELDTDKVTQEVEAEANGVLLKIVVADGEVDVGATVAVIGAQDEDVSAIPPPSGDEMASLHAPEGRTKASPLARRIARERGLDLAAVTGTGP